VLRLFAGIATIAWIALVGLRTDRSWAPAALLAVSVAESLAWIGTILGGWEIFSPHRIGYWAIIVSVIVVFAGAITVWLSARRSVSEQQQPTTV
jgi:hypothetical protein